MGAGPAGLEVALALGRRGYAVTLAEATRELGGRVNREASLPGLSAWIRVRDYRSQLLEKMVNVEIYRESQLGAEDVLELGADHVVLATGSHWRRDGIGAYGELPVEMAPAAPVFTPDDIFAGAELSGPVVIYDDDHYFMAGALAERFVLAGHPVTYITTESKASAWTVMTDEQDFIQRRLLDLGVELSFSESLSAVGAEQIESRCLYSGAQRVREGANLVLVTGRLPERGLYDDLMARADRWGAAGIKAVTRIGDCLAPSSIADAVYGGHRFARGLDDLDAGRVIRRERPPAH